MVPLLLFDLDKGMANPQLLQCKLFTNLNFFRQNFYLDFLSGVQLLKIRHSSSKIKKVMATARVNYLYFSNEIAIMVILLRKT